MILAETYFIDPQIDYLISKRVAHDIDFSEAVKLYKSLVTEKSPLAYLKDTVTGHFIEMKFIESQHVVSYVLDLFDFQKEFFEVNLL